MYSSRDSCYRQFMPSMYERLGGEAGVMAAVVLFYSKVTEDETIAHFFEEVDMVAQARKQVAFMSRAFGGPVEHQGKDLREAHQRLVDEENLGDLHFDAVTKHLGSTLSEMGVEDALRGEVLAVVNALRDEVLCR